MFDETYYDEFLSALTERASIRNNDMKTEDAILRALYGDYVIPELLDEEVTRSILEHGHSRADKEMARVFARRLKGIGFEDPKQSFFAGMAFHILFQDVQKQLYEGAS